MESLLYHISDLSGVEGVIEFIDSLDEVNNLKKKLAFTSVEIIQNIIHHSDKDKLGNNHSYFTLLKDEISYIIKSGNFIEDYNLIMLLGRLSGISNLTSEQVSDEIKFKLRNEEFTEKGGAGIGLLSIQKKTGSLTWSVEELESGNIIHFTIQVN